MTAARIGSSGLDELLSRAVRSLALASAGRLASARVSSSDVAAVVAALGQPTVRSATALKSPILQELGPGQVPGDRGHVEGLS